jgi:hypothetical protein
MRLFFSLHASGKPIRVDFSTDRGNFRGEASFEKYELLSPLCMSVSEFTAARKKLGGFNENSCKFTRKKLEEGNNYDNEVVVEAVLDRVNAFLVEESEAQSDRGGGVQTEYRLAACYRKDQTEEKMLMLLSCR